MKKSSKSLNPEQKRLQEDAAREKNWKRWGPYLSERQWGTVREDYSAKGDSWNNFSHDQARSRAYRWGEDGLLGFTDRQCRLCFGLALWNEQDPILKERLFGLTGPQGNHGEDCKELYYYLESTPTHSYFKSLYKYPQTAYPYSELITENKRRGYNDPEFEILDTHAFEENRYWDVTAEYAKESPNDILIKISVTNQGPEEATLHLLPTLWFRNTWIWGCEHEGCTLKPSIKLKDSELLETQHQDLPPMQFAAEGSPEWLFTENETNSPKLFKSPSYTHYFKDAFHEYLIQGETDAVKPDGLGTKAAAHYTITAAPGETHSFRLRLFPKDEAPKQPLGRAFEKTFTKRLAEMETFYASLSKADLSTEENNLIRQAYAGLLHSKQFYHYSVKDWLQGDKEQPPPPSERYNGRNKDWQHLFNRDIISMPDKWEYPWYAAWDLAFHMIPFNKLDPQFAKEQLILMLREWYMHPNGQIPAYEFNFSDVNPPVHAWAVWRIYKMTGKSGQRDLSFLRECFHKLLINFTWWVNRKDPDGKNLFAGGFLGLDNIGAFDRSKPLPGGARLEQADGTAWMAFYCSTMLSIALELAAHDPAYDGVASKFFEHFVAIAEAINIIGKEGLWNERDGFYYDELRLDNGQHQPMAIRSMVGLIPLCAVEILNYSVIERLPGFRKRMDWFLEHKQILTGDMGCIDFQYDEAGNRTKILLAIASQKRLKRILKYLLDENEFLSSYGFRSLSKHHEKHPYVFSSHGQTTRVAYLPAESDSWLFGGNSNWRGPIWFPVNYLILESLEKYAYFYGDSLKVEYPTGSGELKNLSEIAQDVSKRLVNMFLPKESGERPIHRDHADFYKDPANKDLILFYEYFHGDNGRGIGASHQTGWTGLVAKMLEC